MSTFERLEMAMFERLLEIHGSRIGRWPEASREPLRRLLESSDVARARWSEAEHLDALLDAVPEVEPTPELMARITSLPARHPRTQRVGWWPFQNPLTPLFTWGAAAALGLLMGVIAPDFTGTVLVAMDPDAPADVAALDAPAPDDDSADDWSEMSGLAMGAEWASEDD
jgi:hypothetical protein